MTEAIVADQAIDITGEICPMTFVRTRLALDRLAPGQILSVTLRGEEPLRNVPLSAARQGHTVLSQTAASNGSTTLLIRRASPNP
jgi:TusA-related sulfurtransferase